MTISTRGPRDKHLPPEEPQEFDLDVAATSLPLAPEGEGAPADHASFDEFWDSLGLPEDEEHLRLRELFFEWLGQRGFGVHARNEPTIIGDLVNWRVTWARYLSVRKLR